MKNAKLKSFKPRNLKPKSAKLKDDGLKNKALRTNLPVKSKLASITSSEKQIENNVDVRSKVFAKLELIQKKSDEEKSEANKALKVFVFIAIFALSEALIPDFALLSDLNKKKLITSEDKCLHNIMLIASSVEDYNYKRGSRRAMKELDLSRLGILNQVCGVCNYSGYNLDGSDTVIDKISCKTHGTKTMLEKVIAGNNRMKILARISLFIVKIIVITAICYVI